MDNPRRDYDTVARYGGEEFAVIMPDCTPRQCRALADRLRKVVSKVPAEVRITMSVGAGMFPRHAKDAEGLIAVADQALYRSKREGRDRATMYAGRTLDVVEAPAAAG